MDELELLKKDWQKKEVHLPKLTYDEIYKMIWKKSSSIVKWIFYISIIEFILPHLFYLIPSVRNNFDIYSNMGLSSVILVASIVQYLVIFYFIYEFYKRYREISVLDSAKQLTANILKTRKTVKYYIILSLSMVLFTFAMLIVGIYFSDNVLEAFDMTGKMMSSIPLEKAKLIIMASFAVTGILFTLFLGGIYFLLYGLLTRKLRKNYKELQRLEV